MNTMTCSVWWGVFSIGFIFGYLLYYVVRHTDKFNIEMLATAIGALAGGTIIGFFGDYKDWIGPYGLGLISGFVIYLIFAILMLATGQFAKLSNIGILSNTKSITT